MALIAVLAVIAFIAALSPRKRGKQDRPTLSRFFNILLSFMLVVFLARIIVGAISNR